MARTRPKYEAQDFVLKSERNLPATEQTVWKLKGLRQNDLSQVGDLVDQGKPHTAAQFAVQRGLIGWSNFLGVDGKVLEFEGRMYPIDESLDSLKRISPEELELLPREIIGELGKELMRISMMSVDEKNS